MQSPGWFLFSNCLHCAFYLSSRLPDLISMLVSLAILVYWSCHWPMPHQDTCFLFYFPFMCRCFYNYSGSSSLTCTALAYTPYYIYLTLSSLLVIFSFPGKVDSPSSWENFCGYCYCSSSLSVWYIMHANFIFSNTLRRMKSIEWNNVNIEGRQLRVSPL